MTAPDWLLEQHRTVEAALAAATEAVADSEAEVTDLHRAVHAAMDAKIKADADFAEVTRSYSAAHDRLQNRRRHRDWVQSLV